MLVGGGNAEWLLQAEVTGAQAAPGLVLDGMARYVKEATA